MLHSKINGCVLCLGLIGAMLQECGNSHSIMGSACSLMIFRPVSDIAGPVLKGEIDFIKMFLCRLDFTLTRQAANVLTT